MKKSFHTKVGSVRITVDIFFLVSVVMLFFSEGFFYPAILLFCAIIHELGHAAAIKLCGLSVSELYLSPFGAEMSVFGLCDRKSDLLIAASGPFVNLVSGLLFLILFYIAGNEYIAFAVFCNFFLLVLNVIPVKSFDGHKMLESLVMSIFSYEKALKILIFSELISIIVLCLFSVCAVIFFDFNLSLILFCSYIFLSVYLVKY